MAGLVEDKVALVTGAASGIGRATAQALAREGARVMLSDLDDDAGQKTAATLAEARYVHCDVTSEDSVKAMVAATLDAFGRLDCAVNNAGITPVPGPLHDLALDEWNRTLAINLTSVFLCMKYEIPVMQKQGAGAIVNMASGAGIVPTPGLVGYCASKHGVLGITKTAAVENATTGVRVNALCPGCTDTPMLRTTMDRDPQIEKMILASLPGGRLGNPEEVAEAAVWLCSDRASFVSGDSMLVDGAAVAR